MMKNIRLLPLLVAAAVCLCGCSARELEDRVFPQAMELELFGEDLRGGFGGFLAEGNDVSEIQKNYQKKSHKYLDLGHVKAIVLGERLYEDKERLRAVLEELSAKPVLARNTLVFSYGYEDGKSVLKKMEEKGIVFGEYLSDLYKNNPDQESSTATLGELCAAEFERT